jgi:hypothetical protein
MAAARQHTTFRKSPPTIKRQTRDYDAANRECAEIILRDPVNHTPVEVLWAELFMARLEDQKCRVGPKLILTPTTNG